MPIRIHVFSTSEGIALVFEDIRYDAPNEFTVIHSGTLDRRYILAYMLNRPGEVYSHKRIITADEHVHDFDKRAHYAMHTFNEVTVMGLTYLPHDREVLAKVYGMMKGRPAILSALIRTTQKPWKRGKIVYPVSIDPTLLAQGKIDSVVNRDGTWATDEDRYDVILQPPYGEVLFRRKTQPVPI